MPIVITPEVGIPLPFDTTPDEIEGFREKAHSLFETVQELVMQGATVEITDSDKAASHQIAAQGKIPPVKELTPGTIINLEAILSEWDQEVLDVGRRLRNYVTNKLIMESVDPDARQRMKALENLGKISSVGLFSDRVEVNVTHRSIDSIETELRKTLELYMGPVDVADTELDAVQEEIKQKELAAAKIAALDMEEVLGLKEEDEHEIAQEIRQEPEDSDDAP